MVYSPVAPILSQTETGTPGAIEGTIQVGDVSLLQSSPGVTALIRRYLGDSALGVLDAQYESAVAAGGNRERGIVREEGVSFNPRLARVITILIEAGVREVQVLVFALRYGALGADEQAPLLPDVYRVQAAQCGATAEGGLSDEAVDLVATAYALDFVRHLHMTTFPADVRVRCLERAEVLLREFSSLPVDSLVPRKLSHAILIQRRRIVAAEGDHYSSAGGVR